VQSSRGRQLLVSVAVSALCAGLLLGSSSQLPMVWDEGNAIWRAEGIGAWFGLLLRGGAGRSALAPATIDHYWRYTTQIEGHPPVYGMVIAAGRFLGTGWLPPLAAARLGPILLFSFALGAVFYRLWQARSLLFAMLGVAAIVLLPRLFAHAHFASIDGPLTSCWMLAWTAFIPARKGRVAACFFGAALGATAACKATGWFAPLPFVAWTLLYRDRPAAKALLYAAVIGPVVFFLLNPPLWHDPLGGLLQFATLNLNRQGFNVSIQFLGRLYDLYHPLPWYNTLFWTAVTVPAGLLVLFVLKVVDTCCRRDPGDMLLLLCAGCLLVVRALPFAPPHDGVRLFLPAFPFVALLAAGGACRLVEMAMQAPRARSTALFGAWGLVVASYLGAASSLLWYAPQWLSYYNICIGGLRGAAAIGMEPTYYWDGLDRSVLDWLGANTRPGEKVALATAPMENLLLLARWGQLEFEFRPSAPGRWRWYVLQNRPGAWSAADRRLRARFRPMFRKVIRRSGWGPWRLDVPLVEVYRYADYRAAAEEQGAESG